MPRKAPNNPLNPKPYTPQPSYQEASGICDKTVEEKKWGKEHLLIAPGSLISPDLGFRVSAEFEPQSQNCAPRHSSYTIYRSPIGKLYTFFGILKPH